ncbi:zinc finger protein 691-like [Chelonus insularis]|uniref:zinc finger protein 691-like n=1 Tax=Chelonus insularis TaxID=460826 RepID=UPI00158AF497|nr:zinc finger protein 691-like [Chelonus insularis]XP_034937411.1 zinc finger protein 691-like [Chelonus insularis]
MVKILQLTKAYEMDTNGCNLRSDEELQCRICAEYVEDKNGKMYIFDDDAKKNYLQTKIRKYLYVLVSLEDRLPKMVCLTCVRKLESIHRFASMAHKAQEKLRTQFCSQFEEDDIKKKDDDDDNDDAKGERGLLRSILIGKSEDDLEDVIPLSPPNCSSHPIRSIDEESGLTEEMEVKVDPMIFLQCGLDRSASPNVSDLNSDEEKSQIKDISSSNEDEETKRKSTKTLLKSAPDPDDNSEEVPTKFFNCTICSHTFETQIGLQNHLWSHLPRAEYQYDDDDDKLPSMNNQRIYSNNSSVIQNGEMENSGGYATNGNFICPICNKKISTKGNLKVHLETHRPKGKYGCDICGRIFKTQSNLFRHKEYHGGIQFPCSVCGRVYPTNSTLRAHSITHSDLRPHACPLCDKTFKRNQDLKFHINQHTGARPYQCPYCPKAFASSGNCFSHRKRMHPKEVHRDRQRAADLMR